MALLRLKRIGSVFAATHLSTPTARLTRLLRAGGVALVVLAASAWVWPAQAAERVAGEYEIKAAFLYNFAQYIEWPSNGVADAGDTFVIGILGEDPFGDAFDNIARDKTIQGKRIVVRRFATVEDYTPCHILFVAPSAVDNVPALLERIEGSHVLLAGDTEGLAQRGIVINFFIEKSKVRFEINVDAATRMGLKISSKLLRLAKIVSDKNEA